MKSTLAKHAWLLAYLHSPLLVLVGGFSGDVLSLASALSICSVVVTYSFAQLGGLRSMLLIA